MNAFFSIYVNISIYEYIDVQKKFVFTYEKFYLHKYRWRYSARARLCVCMCFKSFSSLLLCILSAMPKPSNLRRVYGFGLCEWWYKTVYSDVIVYSAIGFVIRMCVSLFLAAMDPLVCKCVCVHNKRTVWMVYR